MAAQQLLSAHAKDETLTGQPWRRRGLGGKTQRVAFCRVDADGVAADWVEATPARIDQMTLICFFGGDTSEASLASGRHTTGQLALATGARVLSIGCRSGPQHPPSTAVEDGVAAYAWLVGEGCDLNLAAFVDDVENGVPLSAMLRAASDRGLPLPRHRIRWAPDAPASASMLRSAFASASNRACQVSPPA